MFELYINGENLLRHHEEIVHIYVRTEEYIQI